MVWKIGAPGLLMAWICAYIGNQAARLAYLGRKA